MKFNIVKALVIGAVAVIFAGCASEPAAVYNVDSTQVSVGSQAEVRQAVARAGLAAGWLMSFAQPGEMYATRTGAGREAIVLVSYDANSYSISLDESSGFGYMGETIDPMYNNWVAGLESAINAELGAQ